MGLIKTMVPFAPLRGILYLLGILGVLIGTPAAMCADVVRLATYDAGLLPPKGLVCCCAILPVPDHLGSGQLCRF